ncbi:MAG: hypothetical protein GYB66_10225, partial [Chloroflexi bacterium]|nr:hypothetical protein [Chloroflexota bacterium]
SLLGYHENQPSYTGPDWRYAQKLDSAAWFDWQPPQHRDTPLVQYRRGAGSLFTSSIDHRRAARRIFKICTQEYVAANLLAQLLASQGEGRQIRSAIQSYCRSQGRDNALYFDLLTKLNRLEARMLLLGTNIANPEWVLDNPLGEGEHFIELMRHISDRFSTASHVQALRQQLDLFNMMLDRCR